MSERSFVVRTPPEDGVSAVHEALEELWAETPGIASWDRMSFETALIELTSNIVQHARSYRHIICLVEISVTDDELREIHLATLEVLARTGVFVALARPIPAQRLSNCQDSAFFNSLASSTILRC